jgi:D-methionine transport system ATP-binding protein
MVSFGGAVDFQSLHVQIRDVNKFYQVDGRQVQALKNIDLDIPQGKILGIIGKSGAGKSSLLRTINGLEQINSGSIHIHQQQLSSLKPRQLIQLRQRIGMIFQHFNLLSAKTVWQNVALPLQVAKVAAAEIEQRVNEVLQWVGLTEHAQHYPAQLSGGQKQRVGIARALVHRPEMLLCDEATSALDPESTAVVLDLLKKINQSLGITIVLITHEMQVIREICDQVVVLDQGQIIEAGQVWSVFSNPQQPLTRELLHLAQWDLPFELQAEAHEHSTQLVLKLHYQSAIAQAPDLKRLFGQLPQPVRLYLSHLDHVQQHLIGTFVIATLKQHHASILAALEPHFFSIEVLGYA